MQVQIAPLDRNWGMAAHLSALVAIAGLPFGHVVGPLVVYLIKAHESEFVAEHARASLNYQITVSLVGLVGILVAIGVMLALLAGGVTMETNEAGGFAAGIAVLWICVGVAVALILLCSLIFIIMGTVAASEGRPYTYPFAIRFLR